MNTETKVESGFKITQGKGFHIIFENGWTVSVQFGAGNYSDNYNTPFLTTAERLGAVTNSFSRTAEIAAWDADQNWHNFDDDQVKGYVSPDDVLAFLNEIAAKEPA